MSNGIGQSPYVVETDGHHFELRQRQPGGTVVAQSERFTGVLVPFLARGLRRTTPAGFEAMNQALKVRAERRSAVADE